MIPQGETESPKPRKEEILDVATVLFAERGYDGTSMNDVAGRVGMRKASLFYHFATKDSLYEAVLDRLVSQLAGRLTAIYVGEASFLDRLDAAIDIVTEVLGQRPAAARLLLREAMDWGPVIQGKLLGPFLGLLEAATAFIRAGQAAGAFLDGDAKQLVLTGAGAHVLPFAIDQLVERYVGASPFDPRWIQERRAALREQVRNLFARRA
jgi:AcrR family transcriptional regulator